MEKSNISLSLKSILVNFSHLAFGEFASKAFGFLTTVYLARVLGVEQFGIYSFVMAIFSYGLLVSNFGFETYGTIEIVKNKSIEIISSITIIRLLYAVIAIVGLFGISLTLTSDQRLLLLIQSISLLLVPFYFQFVARGHNKMGSIGLSKSIHALLFFLLAIIFITDQRLLLIPVLWFFATMVSVLPLYSFVKKYYGKVLVVPTLDIFVKTIRDAFPWGISNAILALSINLGIVFLGIWKENAEVGSYSVAFKIYFFGYTMTSLLYSAFLPRMSANGPKGNIKVTRQYVIILSGISLLAVSAGILFPKEIIPLLFGEGYEDAVIPLRVLLAGLSITILNFAYINPIQATGRIDTYNRFLILRLILFVIFCAIFIPSYGAVGASLSLLGSEIAVIPYSVYHYHKKFYL